MTSDTHFFHDNVLKFTRKDGSLIRGALFESVEHMNEVLIENWNNVVKPGDYVYHLGDVVFGNEEEFKKLWPKLNGRKTLIVGNHDNIRFLSSGGFFREVLMWKNKPDWGVTLTHVPIHEDCFRKTRVNVHGHIHHNPSPEGPYKCVCVEQTNYTPVNLEELV